MKIYTPYKPRNFAKPFSKAEGRRARYWLNGEPVALLGPQDAPGWAFVAHVHRPTFFGIRYSTLSKLPKA